MNFAAWTTTANAVVVPVGAAGKTSIRNGSWMDADVVVDVVGYYSPDGKASYLPLSRPYRMLDTRSTEQEAGPDPARGYAWLPLSCGAKNYEAFVLNTTVTNTVSEGFLSVAPDTNSWDQYAEGTVGEPPRPASSSSTSSATTTTSSCTESGRGRCAGRRPPPHPPGGGPPPTGTGGGPGPPGGGPRPPRRGCAAARRPQAVPAAL
ncbi:hypothetical protein, partial [Streptomyces sp. NPDC004050]